MRACVRACVRAVCAYRFGLGAEEGLEVEVEPLMNLVDGLDVGEDGVHVLLRNDLRLTQRLDVHLHDNVEALEVILLGLEELAFNAVLHEPLLLPPGQLQLLLVRG